MTALARILSRAGHPFMLLAAVTVFLATTNPAYPKAWALLAAGDFLLPGVWLALGIRKGWWADIDVADHGARLFFLVPLAFFTTATAIGLQQIPASLLIRHLAVIAAAWTVTFTLITRWWQLSFHAAAAFGLTVFLWLHYRDPLWLLLVIPALAISWSRLVLGRHTPAQLAAGAVLGPLFPYLWH